MIPYILILILILLPSSLSFAQADKYGGKVVREKTPYGYRIYIKPNPAPKSPAYQIPSYNYNNGYNYHGHYNNFQLHYVNPYYSYPSWGYNYQPYSPYCLTPPQIIVIDPYY